MWLLRLVLIVAVIVAVWYVVRRLRSSGATEVTFTPVLELPVQARQAIDEALAQDDTDRAVTVYRSVTGSSLRAARTAVDTYRWTLGEGRR